MDVNYWVSALEGRCAYGATGSILAVAIMWCKLLWKFSPLGSRSWMVQVKFSLCFRNPLGIFPLAAGNFPYEFPLPSLFAAAWAAHGQHKDSFQHLGTLSSPARVLAQKAFRAVPQKGSPPTLNTLTSVDHFGFVFTKTLMLPTLCPFISAFLCNPQTSLSQFFFIF